MQSTPPAEEGELEAGGNIKDEKQKTQAAAPALVPSSGEDEAAEIAHRLEQSIRDDMTAVNQSNFGPTSPLFHNKHPDWVAELPAAVAHRDVSLHEFVATMQELTTRRPGYTVRPVDFNTAVDVRNGTAEIYANVETSGLFDGVTRRNVTLCEYRRVDGVWLHIAHRTVAGLDVGNTAGV